MSTTAHHQPSVGTHRRAAGCGSALAWRTHAAFTFAEVMVAMALLMLVLTGVITAHLFGVRMYQLARAKLGASDEARIAISKMTEEVRSAKIVRIGSGDLNTFTEAAINSPQQGNAMQIYPSLDQSVFVRYYWDSSDKKLKRAVNNTNAIAVVANCISNNVVFASEDYTGTILTNNFNNRVVSMTLQFYQIQYPIINIGPGNYYDFYQLRTRMTRRVLE